MQRIVRRSIGWALLCLSLCGLPAAAVEPQEGRDYTLVVPALAQPDSGKIVVTEFFSYACPHCAAFAPALQDWEATLPGDVALDRVAVALGRQPWVLPAQLFYALRAIDKSKQLDAAVFRAIHVDRVDFSTTRQVADWAAAQGVERAGFEAALAAFSVKSFVARGDQLATTARIPSVPTLVIDGRYLVDIESTGDLAGQLAIVDALIAKARAERAKGVAQ
jgi:protein dithiol oxidoreductase (disulfide-forming)